MSLEAFHGTGEQVVIALGVVDIVEDRGVGDKLGGCGPVSGGALAS